MQKKRNTQKRKAYQERLPSAEPTNSVSKTEADIIQWHPAFCSAMQMELKDNYEQLKFYNEVSLSKKPLLMDLLIITKEGNVEIKNPIGSIFKKYNILEYKSPGDRLDIDTFYKTMAYACLYKSSGDTVDEYNAEDISISLVRHEYPRKLFQDLKRQNYLITEKSKGIFHVAGSLFATQIIVSGMLAEFGHMWLKSLTRGIAKQDFKNLLFQIKLLNEKNDKENADSLLTVVLQANEAAVRMWKEDKYMCGALAKIMQDELNESKLEGISVGRIEGTITILRKLGHSDSQITDMLIETYGLNQNEAEQYIKNSPE